MVTIEQSTAIISSRGATGSSDQVQAGLPSATTQLVQPGGIDSSNDLVQAGDISNEDKILSFQGIAQDTIILNPSVFSTSIDSQFIIFPNNFSRGVFLAGVMGIQSTVEKFFDRSPFFFTASETDPNTLRDISEAQQFLLFSSISILSFDIFNNNLQTTEIITDRGDPAKGGPAQLLRTNSPAHINTGHPTASGFPFTIFDTDDVTQIDLSGPFFDETNPVSGTRQVSETNNLEFHIKDVSSALDEGTINVKIDGVQVVAAGSTVTGTLWPMSSKTVLAPNNIEYIFQPAGGLTPGATITVSGAFADLAAVSNFSEETYQFTVVGSGGLFGTISGLVDADPPVSIPTDPEDLDTQISPDTGILFSITDNALGVDPATVKLLLNSATKIENDIAFDGTFSRIANSSRGFDYTYTPNDPFALGISVTGSIIANDFAGNTSTTEYEFTVTPDNTLNIEGFFLDINQSTLLTTGTNMTVDVVDLTHGVASGTTTLTVNGVAPSGLSTVFSGSGPDRVLYSLPLESEINFREDLVVLVHAENKFPGAFPVIKEQEFILRPGYDVNWPNTENIPGGGPEITFPYVTNIQVLTEVKNFAKNFGQASAFFDFLTEGQHHSDLGASLESNIKIADISASIISVNPFFEYGKEIVLEIEADDLVGNQFRLTHTFIIESKP